MALGQNPQQNLEQNQNLEPEQKSEEQSKQDFQSKKKSLLIATDNFMPRIDGIARFLEMIIPELEKKYDVTVLAPDFKSNSPKSEDKSYKIHRIPLMKFRIGDFKIPKKPKKNQIQSLIAKSDLIFSQTMGPIGSTVVKYAFKQQKTILSFAHSIEWILVEKSLSRINFARSIISLIAKAYVKKTYNKCTGIIVPSSDVGEILSLLGIKKPKYITRLGIDANKFSPLDRDQAKISLGFDKDDFIVGYVGRIAREKNLLTLLKAFKRIETSKKKLIIVGDGIDSIKKKIMSSNVTLVADAADVIPYLRAMDAFVMPSLTETTCLAALEAMSCEVPVIATKVGSIPNYIMHGKNGLLFPKKNDAILSIRLNYINSRPMIARSLGKAARRTVLQSYSWDSSKQQILKIISHHID